MLETSSTVRLFSDSLKSLDDAAVRLRDTVPWTCEAVVRVDRAGFRRWVLAEFAGAKRFGDQMQVRVGWDHLGRLVVNGVANSLVENALDTIAAAVPVLEVCEFLRSYVEPTRRYGRQSRRVENLRFPGPSPQRQRESPSIDGTRQAGPEASAIGMVKVCAAHLPGRWPQTPKVGRIIDSKYDRLQAVGGR